MHRLLFLLFALCLGVTSAMAAAPAAQHHKLIVYFQIWSADLDETAQGSIDAAVKWAVDHPRDTVHVTGFASTVGSKRANGLLADLRAQMVVDRLIEKGVPANRIKLASKGASRFVSTSLESRRAEISVDGK